MVNNYYDHDEAHSDDDEKCDSDEGRCDESQACNDDENESNVMTC